MAGFFRILWCINAVLAFFAASAALAFVALMAKDRIDLPLLNNLVSPPQQQQPSSPAVPTKIAYSYQFEPDIFLGPSTDNADFELFRLLRWGKADGHPVTLAASATVNLLVQDKKTNANHWLFSGFDRAILAEVPILTGRWYYHEPQSDDDVPVELMVLRVVEADSDNDGVLTSRDRQTLYAVRLPAAAPEKILTADQIYFTRQMAKTFQVSYREAGHSYLVSYSLPDFKEAVRSEISAMPQ